MIKVKIDTDRPVSYPKTATKKEQAEIDKVNRHLGVYFIDEYFEFPVVPLAGMLINLASFYRGDYVEAENYIEEIGDLTITAVIIRSGYLVVRLEK